MAVAISVDPVYCDSSPQMEDTRGNSSPAVAIECYPHPRFSARILCSGACALFRSAQSRPLVFAYSVKIEPRVKKDFFFQVSFEGIVNSFF